MNKNWHVSFLLKNFFEQIDTSEEGQLSEGLHLRPFNQTFEYAPLSEASKLNLSVNVYDDGNVVQVFFIFTLSTPQKCTFFVRTTLFPTQKSLGGGALGGLI